MKKVVLPLIAILSAFFIIAAVIFRDLLGGWLSVALNWAVVLSGVTLLVALARLLITHLGYIARGRQGFIYSLVAVLAFAFTVIAGLLFGMDDPKFLRAVAAVVRPLETALLGLVAVVMASLAIRFFRERGWNALTISFTISALVFLLLGLGAIQSIDYEPLASVVRAIEALPMIGARGLLIGIALGAILMGMRVLTGTERPYDD